MHAAGSSLNVLTDVEAVADSVNWTELMPEQKLQMDHMHTFDGNAITGVGSVTHVRLNIYPDGGVRRFRVFGQLAQERNPRTPLNCFPPR